MKNLLIKALLIVAAAPVFAQEAQPVPNKVLVADLTQFDLQKGSALENSEIVGGQVSIDRAGKKVNLFLVGQTHCPKGAKCLVGPMTFSFKATLKSQQTDGCGAKVYHAVSDLRPVDGILTDITVVDNTTITCKTLVALPPTVVTLTTQSLRDNAPEVDRMTGKKLQALLQPAVL